MPRMDEMLADLDAADRAGDFELAKVIAAKIKASESSVAGDVARTVPWSLPKLAAGVLGSVGSVKELADAARNKVGANLPDWAQRSDAFLRAINPANAVASMMPSAGQIRQSVEQTTGVPWYEPQTRVAKTVDTALQTAPMLGRNLLTAPGLGLLAGITGGTEVAGALTNDNPWARLIGGLLGGGVPAVVNAAKSRPGVVLREAVGNVTPQEISQARLLEQQAQATGVPLMGTEALDRGHALTSAVLANPSGNRIIENFARQRPQQVQAAVNRDIINQTGARQTPDINIGRAEKAATDVISRAEAARTAAVNPLYAAADQASVPPNALRPLSSEIQNLIYRNPVDAPADRALASWYRQAFPEQLPPEAAAVTKAGKAGGASRMVNPNKDDIVTAIRKLGGINPADERVGSLAKAMPFDPNPMGSVWRKQQFGGAANRTHTTAGHSLDEMSSKLYELGYINSRNGLDDVLGKLEDASLGVRQHFSTFYEPPSSDPLVNALNQLTEQLSAKNVAREAKAAKVPPTVAPETNLGRLHRLYKDLKVQADVQDIGATSKDKLAAYPAQQVRNVLGDILKTNTNFRNAEQTFAAISQQQVDPLLRGPVGVVAGRQGFDPAAPSGQARVLSTIENANTARPETIRTLYQQLNAADRQAFPGMVQTHLENKLNTALGDLRSGPNPTAGAKFRDAIAGTPQDAANFEEMMRGVAIARGKNPNDVVQGAKTLLTILDRTGRTPAVGSMTATRGEINKELSKTMGGDTMSTLSLTPLRPLGRRYDDWINRGRYEELAKALTAPDSVDQLVKLAKLKPNSLSASYFAAAMLGLGNANAGDQSLRTR